MNVESQQRLGEAIQNRNARIGQIQFIPALHCHDALNDFLAELIDENSGAEIVKLIVGGGEFAKALASAVDGDNGFGEDFSDICPYEKAEIISEALSVSRIKKDWPTLLVSFETPVRQYSLSSSGYSFSWGRYNTFWVAGRSFREIARQAIQKQNELIARWKADGAPK